MESTSGAPTRALRFGIMVQGQTLSAWEAQCIENLVALDGVEPALLIIDDRPTARPRLQERVSKLIKKRSVGWRLYNRLLLDRVSRSTKPVDISSLLGSVPFIKCRPGTSGKGVQRFSDADIAEVRAYDLDFVLRFAFSIIHGEMLTVPRYGIWSFHHDDPDKYRGSPPCFWEIYHGDPVTGAVLQRINERLDSGIILHKGYFKTDRSYARSRDNAFFGTADWPARICRDIQNGEAGYFDAAPSSTKAPIFRDPTNSQMLRFAFKEARAWLRTQVHSLYRHQQWSIGLVDAPAHVVAGLAGPDAQSEALRAVRWAPEPAGRFLADPFALPPAGKPANTPTVLAEDYDWLTGRGSISSVFADGEGPTSTRPALRLPHHLSYPYLFEHDGATYCVPESHEAREVALFRMGESPEAWTRCATLLSGMPVVDPTIFQHGGLWWLFCTRQDAGPDTKLHAWFATTLAGPWTPHPANPLKTDVRSSRPAGKPFLHAGQLYRPAQDCSSGYGSAIVFNRIDRLTTVAFKEEPVSTLRPDPDGRYNDGLHTICGFGDRTIIDGSRRAFVREAFQGALKRKARRFLKGRAHDPATVGGAVSDASA